MPTPERIVAVSKGRHGVRPVAVTILCEIQRLRQNSVPIGALLALMLLTRLITRTGARFTCGPRGCGSASHHTIGSTVHLSWVLAALLFVPGGAAGLLFSPMNALAVLVERDYPKSSKNSFRPRGT
jgi:hypothetical protein